MNKKAVKILVFVLLLLAVPPKSQAERPEVVLEFNEHDAVVLGANMLMNGSMGGTGAYLTAHPNAGLKDFPKMMKSRIYWQGFYQGAIGGSLVYTGMKTMTMQPEFEYSILAGKQISDLGTSITYSASENQDWFQNPSYITDIGPLVLHWRKSTGWKPNFHILPGSLVMIIYNFTRYDFEPEISLQTGMFVFSGNLPYAWGTTSCNSITINYGLIDQSSSHPNFQKIQTLGHEAIHTRWNYFQFMPADTTIDYGINQATEKNGLIRLSFLRYQNQPFRFGADLNFLASGAVGKWQEDGGTPHEETFQELPSQYLFNIINQ